MEIGKALQTIDAAIADPNKGLPYDVFLFATTITPMLNVDLLVQNELGQTLLTWRDDHFSKTGWHVPGGIIRYKEKLAERIQAVALSELGTGVEFDPQPLAINEIIIPGRRERAHFVSFLYRCTLIGMPSEHLRHQAGEPQPDQWRWFDGAPDNLLRVHEIYRHFM